MNRINIALVLMLTFMQVACTNLKEVREYASESAKLSAYTDLTTRFRDTYEREQPYIFGETERLAQDNDRKRKASYEDLVKIQQGVSVYMQTLAVLAGEDSFDLSKELDLLAGGIKAHPDLGVDKKQVDAFMNITQVITRSGLNAYQKRAVRDMVKAGDDSLQVVLEGMIRVIGYYKQTNDNEKNTVLGFLELEIAYADAPKDRLLAALARAHLQSKLAEYKNVQAKYAAAEKGIRSIAEGHHKLRENSGKLSNKEVKSTVKQLTKDIKAVRENLQAAHN